MLDDRLVIDLRVVLRTQNHLLRRILGEFDSAAGSLSGQDIVRDEIGAAAALLSELEVHSDFLISDDFDDFDENEIKRIYERRRSSISTSLKRINYRNWDSFVRDCQAYTLTHHLDPFEPYDVFLTETDLEQLKRESFEAQYRWDGWDYIFVGASGVLSALADFLLVRIPQTIGIGGAYRKGSPITAWLKDYTQDESGWFTEWAKSLEKRCKVPYDRMLYYDNGRIAKIYGMYGKTHRLQSLGHDPVLGFVFGILDIMRGTISGFSYHDLSGAHRWIHGPVNDNPDTVGLIEATLCHIQHLASDVGTPAGLPPPFFSLFQGVNIKAAPFHENMKVGEIARQMYVDGYDFRHFLSSGITPAVIEIVLRAYIMIRHYAENKRTPFMLAGNPKYRSMLLSAHAIAALANAGKIFLCNGNPLAVNYFQWVALFRYLLPSIKYWLFDRSRLKIGHLEKMNDRAWDELLGVNNQILTKLAHTEFPDFSLN